MMMMLVIKNCAETEIEQTDGDLLASAAAAYFDFDFDFRCSFIAR